MKTGAKSWRVAYHNSAAYDIVNAPDLFHPDNPALVSVGKIDHARRFVVVDNNVQRYYSDEIRGYFAAWQIDAKIVNFPGGEENKSIEKTLSILQELDAYPIIRRDEPIIAIGGGVLTDLVGFAASCYRRGVPHINVPTTLMGFIDASIGIKTAINFNGHKNRLGAFAPPVKVFLNRTFLKTLPRRHILNGVCEILKLGLIKDLDLFIMLETAGEACIATNFQDETGEAVLDRSINGMVEEIEPNLYEENLARKVDFGHTFSYGLEAQPGSGLLHGEAVLLDMALSALIARRRDLLSEQDVSRIFRLIARLGVPLQIAQLDAALLWQSLQERTRHRNGSQRVPLPDGIGACVFVNDINLEEISTALKMLHDLTVEKDVEIRQLD